MKNRFCVIVVISFVLTGCTENPPAEDPCNTLIVETWDFILPIKSKTGDQKHFESLAKELKEVSPLITKAIELAVACSLQNHSTIEDHASELAARLAHLQSRIKQLPETYTDDQQLQHELFIEHVHRTIESLEELEKWHKGIDE